MHPEESVLGLHLGAVALPIGRQVEIRGALDWLRQHFGLDQGSHAVNVRATAAQRDQVPFVGLGDQPERFNHLLDFSPEDGAHHEAQRALLPDGLLHGAQVRGGLPRLPPPARVQVDSLARGLLVLAASLRAGRRSP